MFNLKIKYVSYFLFTIVFLSILASFLHIYQKSGFEEIALNFFRAILLFFTGVNLLIYKKWAWWVAVIVIGLLLFQFSFGTYLTIIKPIFNPSYSGVGILRWVVLILNIIVIPLFYYLLLGSTREKFNKIT